MKNTIKITKQLALCFIFTVMSILAYAQPPHIKWCDTCNYETELTKKPDITVKAYTPKYKKDSALYEPCPESDTGQRYIAFIHGLDGTQKSWADAENWTSNNYRVTSGRPHYIGWETSFQDVAYEISKQIQTDIDFQFSTTRDNRCYADDYVIGHSQGGIGTRYLDFKWDTHTHNNRYGDKRSIHGLVTIGSTNGGADIGLTKEEHAAYVTKLISTVVLKDKNQVVYDLAGGNIGRWLSNKFYEADENVNTFIEKNLVPLALENGVHAPTLDELATNSATMDSLRNHKSKMHKLAFYGVETAPECWRVVDNIVTKAAEEYDEFEAVPDGAFMDTMEMVRVEHTAQVSLNHYNIKLNKRAAAVMMGTGTLTLFTPAAWFSPFWYAGAASLYAKNNSLKKENNHRNNAVDFLNNANTEWRFLIGSYHRDSVITTTDTKHKVTWKEKYGFGSKWYHKEKTGFDNWWEAQAYYNDVKVYRKDDMQLSTYTETTTKNIFFPSDGVALCKSQIAFPGAPYDHKPISNEKEGESIYEMFGNNHFQERNSPQTKEKLEALYDGFYDPYWKVIIK